MKKKIIINILLILSIIGFIECKKNKDKIKSVTANCYTFNRKVNSLENGNFTDITLPAPNSLVTLYNSASDAELKVNPYLTGVTDASGAFSFNHTYNRKKTDGTSYFISVSNDSMSTLSDFSGASFDVNNYDGEISIADDSKVYLLPKFTNLKITLLSTGNVPVPNYRIYIYYSLNDYNNDFYFDEQLYFFSKNFPKSIYYDKSPIYAVTDANGIATLKLESLRPYWFKVKTSGETTLTSDINSTSKLSPTTVNEYTVHAF